MHAGKAFFILGFITLLTLTGCNTNGISSAEAPTDTASTSTSAQPRLPQVGEAVEAPGVTLTVESVSEADHLMLHADGVKRGFKPEERLDAPSGGRFITVATTVKNTGLDSWDLTCGFALQAYIFSDKEQRFDPVDELYRLLGNPECNDDVNPGFESVMTWSFAVPDDIETTHFGFADPETHYNDLTLIDIVDATSTTTATTTGTSGTTAISTLLATPETITSTSPQQPVAQTSSQQAVAPSFVECIYGGGSWTSNALMSDGSYQWAAECQQRLDEERAKAPYQCPGTDYFVPDLWYCDNQMVPWSVPPPAAGETPAYLLPDSAEEIAGKSWWSDCIARNTAEYCRSTDPYVNG